MARVNKRVVTFFAPLEEEPVSAMVRSYNLSVFLNEVPSDVQNIIETVIGNPEGGRWRIHVNDFEYFSSLLSTVGAEARIEYIPSTDFISMVFLSYSTVYIQEVL